jgi:CheY-like chemotaxis protein
MPTILHLEDNVDLIAMVRLAFENLDFHGEILNASRGSSALTIIQAWSERNQPVDMIIVDIDLPDRTGLEVIKSVKSNPGWERIPVLVLSNDTDKESVAEAYALGANCYFPKSDRNTSIVEVLQSLYGCWLRGTFLLPIRAQVDPLDQLLRRGVNLTAQCSKIFAGFARIFSASIERSSLWIGLALSESNKSNLLAFLLNPKRRQRVSPERIEKVNAAMTAREASVDRVQIAMKNTSRPTMDHALCWALDIYEDFDPDALSVMISALFRRSPAATASLKACAIKHILELERIALLESNDPAIFGKARSLGARARALEARPLVGQIETA